MVTEPPYHGRAVPGAIHAVVPAHRPRRRAGLSAASALSATIAEVSRSFAIPSAADLPDGLAIPDGLAVFADQARDDAFADARARATGGAAFADGVLIPQTLAGAPITTVGAADHALRAVAEIARGSPGIADARLFAGDEQVFLEGLSRDALEPGGATLEGPFRSRPRVPASGLLGVDGPEGAAFASDRAPIALPAGLGGLPALGRRRAA